MSRSDPLSSFNHFHPAVSLLLLLLPATLISLFVPSCTNMSCLCRWVFLCQTVKSPVFVSTEADSLGGSVVDLRLVLSPPSLYVDRVEFGQTACSTLVISYRGSIDRPWPEVEGEGWRRGRPKNRWSNRALIPWDQRKSLWGKGDASWQMNGLKNL